MKSREDISRIGTRIIALLAVWAVTNPANAKYDWLQFDFTPDKTANNTLETTITLANVGSLKSMFVSPALKDNTDASPVLLTGVNTSGGVKDLVFIQGHTGRAFAFDANTGALVWEKDFTSGPSGSTASAPAIDPNRLYVYVYGMDGFVHKLNVGDGSEVTGGGWPELTMNDNGAARQEFAIATAANGHSYLYSSTGWQIGHQTVIDLNTGSQHVFNTSCADEPDTHATTCSNGSHKAICWSRVGAVYNSALDRIFFTTGTYATFNPGHNWVESILAIPPDGHTILTGGGGYPLDSYTPTEWQTFVNQDGDLGSAGICQLPTGLSIKYPHLGVMGSKDGYIRIFNLADLSGQGGPGHTGGELQRISGPQGGLIRSQGASWTDPQTQNVWVFIPGDNGIAGLQVAVDGAGNPSLQSKWTLKNGWTTSAIVANGVLYAAVGGGEHTSTTSTHTIQAINPTTGAVVWSAAIGRYHWNSPIVANGVLYMADGDAFDGGSAAGNLRAWNLGVLTPDFSISTTPSSQTAVPGESVTNAVNVSAINGFSGTVTLTVSGLPAGASATFNPTSLTGSGSSTLVVTTSANTPLGTYTLTITGTSGNLNHSTTVSLFVTNPSVGPTAMSIDFVGNGTPMGSSETAGVVAKSWWNNATTPSFHMTLLDEVGDQTSVTVTWAADHDSSEGITDSPGNFRMMNGYINTSSSSTTTIQVYNLPPAANGWTVYVYCEENTSGATRTAAYQISGTGITTATINATDPNTFNGTFTQADNSTGNYVVFTIGDVGGFTLTATPVSSTDSNKRAPVNGLQIIPVPVGSPPPAPANLAATAGNAQVSLTWSASSGAASYNVKRSTTSGGPYNIIATGVTATSYTDSGLANGTTYYYVVSAVNGNGESANSNEASATPSGVTATSISINFVGNGTAMGTSESAGVVPKTWWNNATGTNGSGMALVDENGATTAAQLSWSANHNSSEGITNTPGNFRMMNGYVNTSSTSATTVSVSGLAADANGYDVYVYAEENTFGATRVAAYQISGTGITTTTINATDPNTFNGTFTQANNSTGNYAKFSINATAFTLTATPVSSTDSSKRAPLNGIQIIAK